jgi:transglutaminase-like putative cysteine protease
VIYNVRHRTTYRYDKVVTFARCVLRLTPRSSATQTVLESSIIITPAPSHSLERAGPFGEQTLTVVIDQPHDALIIEARSHVDVHAPPVEAPSDSPAWEDVRAVSFETTAFGPDSPATYLYPTVRTPIVSAITEFARVNFPPGRPIIEAAAGLMTQMRRDFVYDVGATTVSSPPAEVFAARRGVCQDFAHIMISGLHGLGLPAAYVSGYLRTVPPPGRPRLEGADATHAWVLVWCGRGRGWIGFDPTNAILVQDDHITLAIGRDYADVAPIDGVALAPGEQALRVEVDVTPEGETEVIRPAVTARPPSDLPAPL